MYNVTEEAAADENYFRSFVVTSSAVSNLLFPVDDDNATSTAWSPSLSFLSTVSPLLDYNSTSSENCTSGLPPRQLPYSTLATVALAAVATILATITAGGNLLVIAAFRIDKQLQRVSNYFLLSLAVADFAIGAVSMPLYTVYLLMGRWPLGSIVCDAWLSLDYTVSNASVANLLLISFDRYMCVTRPLTFRVRRTPRCAVAMIVVAWAVSALLWTPWIVAWPFIEGKRKVPQGECYIQFLYSNPYITIVTAVAAFYLPVLVMCGLYGRIYRETERRRVGLIRLQAHRSEQQQQQYQRQQPQLQQQQQRPSIGAVNGAAVNQRGEEESSDGEASLTGDLRQLYESALRQQQQQQQQQLNRRQSSIVPSTSSLPCWRQWFDRLSLPGSLATIGGRAQRPSGGPSSTSAIGRRWSSGECESSCSCSDGASPGTPTASHGGSVGQEAGGPPSSRTTSGYGSSRRASSTRMTAVGTSTRAAAAAPVAAAGSVEQQPSPSSPSDVVDGLSTVESKTASQKCVATRESTVEQLSMKTAQHRSACNNFNHCSSRKTRSVVIRMITEEAELEDSVGGTSDLGFNSAAEGTSRQPANHNDKLVRGDFLSTSTDSEDHSAVAMTTVQPLCYGSMATIDSAINDVDAPPAAPVGHPARPVQQLPRSPPTPAPAAGISVGRRLTETTETLVMGMQARIASRVTERSRAMRSRRRRQERRQEQKAAKTLSAILLAFVVTWTPYNVITVIQAFCADCVDTRLYEFSYWLCYINSTINPVLYALCNATFRRTYWRIVTCRWRRRRHHHPPQYNTQHTKQQQQQQQQQQQHNGTTG